MVQDATGMWETDPAPASRAAGSLGPGELPQVRSAPQAGSPPWQDTAAGPKTRALEHPTGHTLDTVA